MEGASKYYSVVTDTGNKLMAAALAAGEKLTITEIAVGDVAGPSSARRMSRSSCPSGIWGPDRAFPDDDRCVVLIAARGGAEHGAGEGVSGR